jgi:hypothetical protein
MQQCSRLPCLTPIAGQIIYYLTSGVIGACMQAPYNYKKSYGGGFVRRLPVVSTLRTVKPTSFKEIHVVGTGYCHRIANNIG